MNKKSDIKVSFIVVLRVIIFLFLAWSLVVAYSRTKDFLTSSPVFKIKDVLVESSIQFIDLPLLRLLIGRNIFSVDIHKLQNQIQQRYPQIAQLRVMRVLPDKIKVLAQKRDIILQVAVKSGYLAVDREGVGLYITPKPAALPIVRGVILDMRKVVPGVPLKSKPVETVVAIYNALKANAVLSGLVIMQIQADHPSRIILVTQQGFDLLMDSDDVQHQVESIAMMLKNTKLSLKKIKYIDGRFKEPVIAQMPEEKI